MSLLLCALLGATASVYHASGRLQGSLRRDEPAPVYSDDAQDPWNRIHHLLYTRRVEATVPRYYLDPSRVPPLRKPAPDETDEQRAQALAEQVRGAFLSGAVKVRRLEGGELPEFFFTNDDWDFLLREPRYRRLTAALELEAREPSLAGRTIEARVLFQQDLWNRFDLLGIAWEGERADSKPRRERLRALLGRTIARLAPSREELLRVRPNLDEIARAHRELDPDLLAPDSPWRELLRVVRDGGYAITSHAQAAGQRRVFRVFRRLPRPDAPSSTDGTRVLLVESLLALAADGEIVPLPLIVNVQARELRRLDPGVDGRLDLVDLPFVVLHGSRRALSAVERTGGGLAPLAPDEPVPQVVGCFRRGHGGPLLPARAVCTLCHGTEGRVLMTERFLDTERVEAVDPRNTIAQDLVIRAKRASADYRALKGSFAGR